MPDGSLPFEQRGVLGMQPWVVQQCDARQWMQAVRSRSVRIRARLGYVRRLPRGVVCAARKLGVHHMRRRIRVARLGDLVRDVHAWAVRGDNRDDLSPVPHGHVSAECGGYFMLCVPVGKLLPGALPRTSAVRAGSVQLVGCNGVLVLCLGLLQQRHGLVRLRTLWTRAVPARDWRARVRRVPVWMHVRTWCRHVHRLSCGSL